MVVGGGGGRLISGVLGSGLIAGTAWNVGVAGGGGRLISGALGSGLLTG